MTGRDLCPHCDGLGYTGSEEDQDKEVCEECGGDGVE